MFITMAHQNAVELINRLVKKQDWYVILILHGMLLLLSFILCVLLERLRLRWQSVFGICFRISRLKQCLQFSL